MYRYPRHHRGISSQIAIDGYDVTKGGLKDEEREN